MNIIADITTGLVVTAGAVAAEAETIDPVSHYAGLMERFGVMACLLLYFLLRDYFRNKADIAEKTTLLSKLNSLEEFIREKLMDKLDESVVVIKESRRTHDRLLTALEKNTPCMAEAAKKAKEKLHQHSDSDSQK